jgi:putative (di)nucleoside polyphosphate hydrolase
MKNISPHLYRKNVAIIVVNNCGLILCGERSDIKDVWQIPQGGIDENETPEQAMFRELKEEIGTSEVEIIGTLESPIRYEWPETLYSRGYRGQEQYYFLVELKPEAILDCVNCRTQEFSQLEWLSKSQFISRLSSSKGNGFKNEAYLLALEQFSKNFPDSIKE